MRFLGVRVGYRLVGYVGSSFGSCAAVAGHLWLSVSFWRNSVAIGTRR